MSVIAGSFSSLLTQIKIYGPKKKKEKKKKIYVICNREQKIFCNKNVVYIVCVSFKCYNSKKKNIRNKTNKTKKKSKLLCNNKLQHYD